MFIILSLLLLGMGAGYALRGMRGVHRVEQSTRFTIMLLLFAFGVSIGSNRALVADIAQLGWRAMVIALLGAVGSTVAAGVFQRVWKNSGKKGGAA